MKVHEARRRERYRSHCSALNENGCSRHSIVSARFYISTLRLPELAIRICTWSVLCCPPPNMACSCQRGGGRVRSKRLNIQTGAGPVAAALQRKSIR
jgi:hypothetical protein